MVINGGNWFVSGAPAPRWDVEDLAAVKRVKIREFEVVAMGTLLVDSQETLMIIRAQGGEINRRSNRTRDRDWPTLGRVGDSP